MTLKYQSALNKLKPDFSGYKEFEKRVTFRWVFEDINDPRNFLPRAILLDKEDTQDFTMWGISLFETQKHAKERLLKLVNGRPLIFKALGTHLAQATCNKTHGISEIKVGKSGHFNHFEYKDVKFAEVFVIVEKLAS